MSGGVPLHSPLLLLSSCPSFASPLITGSAVFDGASGSILAVAGVVAVPEPVLLVAVTTVRSVEPTSSCVAVYFASVAALMLAHASPFSLQRLHR